MDFNSNDEYLKAFPPNFGPKLEGRNKLNQLPASDFQVRKVLPENQQDNIEVTHMKQMPEPACLYEELECVEVQEPIQVHVPVYNAENKGDEMLKAHEFLTLCKEDLAPARDKSSLAQPEINEPTPQVVDMTPVMEVQRVNEIVLGESNGEPGEPSVETALSLQAIETRVFDGETLSDTQAEVPPSAIEIMPETKLYCEIPAKDVITIGVIKDSILAFDNIGHYKAEKSVLVDAIEVATMKEETFGFPTLREFVDGTQIGQIETKEPVSSERIKTTTVRTTYESQTSQNELSEHTQIESEVLGTEDATMAFKITEKTTAKAKAICPYEGEEPPFAMNGVPSASNSTTGLDDLATCSDADVDKIVDSIMNDIADIEADMEVQNEEVENEADMESNTQHVKFEICGKAIGMERTATCQAYIRSMGSHG